MVFAMPSDLAKASKGALIRQVEGIRRARARDKSRAEEMGDRVSDVLGSGLALVTGLAVGAAEGRYRNKGGSPLQLGPVPFPVLVATVSTVGGLWTGRRAFNYVAAGALGAQGAKLGKAWGAKQLAKAGRKGVSGVGEDWGALSDAERDLVFGVEDD
jgi:hypothetical protein